MKKTRAIAIFLTCITAASMGATILTGCSGGKDSSTSSSEVSVRAIQDDELESQTDSDSEAESGEGYMYGNPDSFTYGEAVLMNEEELQELNDFIQEMDDDGNPVDYIVDAAYVVPLEFKETDSDETGLTDYAPTMLAVKVGDTWKADIMMTTMQAMYNAFDNGDISFSNSSNDNADDFDEEITIGDAENTEN